MDHRTRALAALLGGLALALAAGCHRDAAFSKPAKELRVLYTNNGDGEIAPCG